MAEKKFTYEAAGKGACVKRIHITAKDGIITAAEFEGGCNGNVQGLCRLAVGMPVDHVIDRLYGVMCKERGTSCPDQFAKALMAMKEQQNDEAI